MCRRAHRGRALAARCQRAAQRFGDKFNGHVHSAARGCAQPASRKRPPDHGVRHRGPCEPRALRARPGGRAGCGDAEAVPRTLHHRVRRPARGPSRAPDWRASRSAGQFPVSTLTRASSTRRCSPSTCSAIGRTAARGLFVLARAVALGGARRCRSWTWRWSSPRAARTS